MRNRYDEWMKESLESYEWFMSEFERLMREHEAWEISLGQGEDSRRSPRSTGSSNSQREFTVGTVSTAFLKAIVYGISTGLAVYLAHGFHKSPVYTDLSQRTRRLFERILASTKSHFEDWKGKFLSQTAQIHHIDATRFSFFSSYLPFLLALPCLGKNRKFQASYVLTLGAGMALFHYRSSPSTTTWKRIFFQIFHRLKYAAAISFLREPWQLLAGLIVSNTVSERPGEDENPDPISASDPLRRMFHIPPPPGDSSSDLNVVIARDGIHQDGPGMGNTATRPSRYLEVLVHNVSHSDMVFTLQSPNNEEDSLVRPRFSCFEKYSELLLNHFTKATSVDNENGVALVGYPRYERSFDSPRFSIKNEPSDQTCPVGFHFLPGGGPAVEDLHELRIRGKDQDKALTAGATKISHVMFPLLANLLPRWARHIEERQYNRKIKRVLVLVTGVGSPRNWTHTMSGNSTQYCAELMEAFLKRVDPDITVVRVHSETNIFRYDENLLFVERELAPVINAYRDAHATGQPYPDEMQRPNPYESTRRTQDFNTEWRKSMSVILSFADGSSARTHAIQAALRSYRPTYFHFWQLKTFWHESKIVDDDIEVHSFEAMETTPAVDTDRLVDPNMLLVVKEMKVFRDKMLRSLSEANDIHKFWLRKTHKPVLAVLLVQSKDMKKPIVYRGTNMEVSMPTGSLCAERNVIGSALADNPCLKREDLKLIAVLAVPFSGNNSNGGGLKHVPSSVSVGSSASVEVVSAVHGEESHTNPSLDHRNSIGSETDEWIIPTNELDTSMVVEKDIMGERAKDPGTSTPVRRIQLFSKSAVARKAAKRTVVIESAGIDMNPLSPCGACNEWLKKIAESNPYFQILTFTDADCHGVYCTPCQE